MTPLYLDYAATTPVAEPVIAAMTACLGVDGIFANPASRSHRLGWQAEQKVETARQDVAALIGADPREIVWTSGATESNNLAIKGLAEFSRTDKRHLITSSVEHKAVLDVMKWMATRGYSVTVLDPGPTGIIEPDVLARALRDETLLVSLMWVNNETGAINPIAGLAELAHERGAVFHVDAAQAVGKLPIDLRRIPVDLLSLSAHKFYGPKGAGALFVRREPFVGISQQMHGGGHERGMRSGTLATHQLVGLGAAASLARDSLDQDAARLEALGAAFWAELDAIDGIRINAEAAPRLPAILNLAFGGVDAETLMMALPELAISSGSACNSESVAPSHVLMGMGLGEPRALSSLRFSFGRYTTVEEAKRAGALVREAYSRLRPRDYSTVV